MQLEDTTSTSAQERVVILDNETLDVLFDTIHPMRLSVKESKRATKFAVEDGTERSDHVVRELTEITMDIMITDEVRNTFANLRQAYLSNTLVTVQTKVHSYENMLIVDFPHDETTTFGDAVGVFVRFQEYVSVQPEYGDLPPRRVANPAQSDTVQRGEVTTEEVPEDRRKSVVAGIFL